MVIHRKATTACRASWSTTAWKRTLGEPSRYWEKVAAILSFLQTPVAKETTKIDIEFFRVRIACLPKILTKIEANEGGRTKYWVTVLLCKFLKLFLRRQVFQDRCLLRLTSNRTARFKCNMRANTNKTNRKFKSKLCRDKKLEIIWYFRFFRHHGRSDKSTPRGKPQSSALLGRSENQLLAVEARSEHPAAAAKGHHFRGRYKKSTPAAGYPSDPATCPRSRIHTTMSSRCVRCFQWITHVAPLFHFHHSRVQLMSTEKKTPLEGRLQKKKTLKVFDHQIHQKLATYVDGVSLDAQ